MTHDPGRTRPDSVGLPQSAPGLQELEARLLLSASPLDDQAPVELESASQAEVVAAGVGDQVFGIDVSHWQGSINWSSVLSSGKEFVWAKATQGVNFIDSKWFQNISGASNAGLYAGGYHYATPYTGGVNDAAAEASDFYDAVSSYLGDGYLRPALDLEEGESLSTTALTNWVHDFMDTFSTLSSGIVPIIYMNGNYINQVNSTVKDYDLWYANPTNNPSSPPTAPGGYTYDLWQYSWTTSVPGIAGEVDGNVFFGDLSEFAEKYVISTVPDDHGDDDTEATAVGLPSFTLGELETTFDTDWFEFNLTNGNDYSFSVVDAGLGSVELSLYSDTGTLIATDSGPAAGGVLAELAYNPAVGGTFYLEVKSSGVTGSYGLAVQEADDHGDDSGSATELTALVAGGIQISGDVDYFHLSATAGMQYDIQVQDFGIADAVLTLYDGVGGVIDTDSGSNLGGTHAQVVWTAPSTGDFYVAVSAQTGTVGDYFITMSESQAQLTGDLDGDGFVGINDLNVVLSNWNLNVTQGDLLLGDPSDDGFVGIDDLNIVLSNWNAGTPPTASEITEAIAAAYSGAIVTPEDSEQSEVVAAGVAHNLWRVSVCDALDGRLQRRGR